jgi:rubredoxin
MRCRAIVTFTTARGEIPAGSILNIPDHLLAKLSGKVEALPPEASHDAAQEPNAPLAKVAPATDWRPIPKAWLTPDGELRTQGVFESLADEIRKLTSDNLPLQEKLLRLHCGDYCGVGWLATIRKWRERARHLFEVEGMELHPANYQAAQEMHLLCFAEELGLKEPPK